MFNGDSSLAERLADAERRAEIQYVVTRSLSDSITIETAVATLLPSLAAALSWSYAGFWLVEGEQLRCAQVWSEPDEAVAAFGRASQESTFSEGVGLPGRCWATGEAVWLHAIQRDPSLPRARYAAEAGLRGALAFPVTTPRGTVGVIEGFSRAEERISEPLLHLTTSVGGQIGQFISRREAEQRLERNEARYAAIVNGALDAIVAIDENDRVTEFNAAAEVLFGFAREDVLGRDMATLIIPPRFRAAHHAGMRRQRESGESRILGERIEMMALRADGSEFPVELTVTRLPDSKPRGFIGFLRDITERQRHAQERELLLEREREALREASEASRLKDEFLAALSHELRTPLNAILGWAQMWEKGAIPRDRQRQALAKIRQNAETQQQLVDDLLDLSAFIAGRVRLNAVPLPIREPILAAYETIAAAASGKNLTLRVDVPDVTVSGDRTRLQQVFWNLLGNAVKFTPPAGHIEIVGALEPGALVIHVKDSGVGVDPAFLPFVFDRFRQGAGARQRGGLGLGLAIVKQIVEAHGGTVTVDSKGGGAGAVFSVRLPTGM